jgi:penicillin amidase
MASPFRQSRTVSNEFAVAGARTATGAPLLAGHPHLGFQFPSLWYLARIDTPDATLAGATAPGVPFLILGRNRDIAWTFTTNAAAVQDIFVFRRLDAAHSQGPDGALAFGVRHERIAVAGRKPVDFTVRTTIDGPVVGAGGHRVSSPCRQSLQPAVAGSSCAPRVERHAPGASSISRSFRHAILG